MLEQGYRIANNTIYQDNQSAAKMEINGRNSYTGNSRHINIRRFFVKYQDDKGEVKIEYCTTNKMLADFFTKTLQGRLFIKLRDATMGHKHITTLLTDKFSIKDRVGDKKKSQI